MHWKSVVIMTLWFPEGLRQTQKWDLQPAEKEQLEGMGAESTLERIINVVSASLTSLLPLESFLASFPSPCFFLPSLVSFLVFLPETILLDALNHYKSFAFIENSFDLI